MLSSIMPSLGRALSPKGTGKVGAAAAAPAGREDDAPSEEFEFKGSDEEKDDKAAEITAPAAEPASTSPSPYQAICDLVEATCHDIILLEGSEPGAVAPFETYEIHAMRLSTYQGQLEALVEDEEEEEEGDEERPLLKDEIARCRYIMGTLVIEACARLAYPGDEEDDEEEEEEKYPALIRLTADKWAYMRKMLGKLQDMMPVDGSAEDVSSFQSLDSQLAAMEALAKLRGQLEGKAAELEEGGGKKYQAHLNFVKDCLEEYKSCDALEGIPDDTADMFVPQQMLSTKQRCTSVAKVKAMVNSLLEGIDDLIAKEAFPLQSFQAEMLKCVRGWETSYLPVPKLFAVGYFGDKKKGAQKTRAGGDDGETPVIPNKKAKLSDENKAPKPSSPSKGRGRTKGNKRKKAVEQPHESSDSEDSWMMADDPPAAKRDPPAGKRSPKKKQKRVPYSYEEKEALRNGVQKFGTGKWEVILDEYKDVFQENGRTNVNLKDLYRTLKNRGEI